MAKMSNRKKEAIAVNAIEKETFEETSYLEADIPKSDKKPSFDGLITVYKDDSERKESYMNDVPTQVKGTKVQKFTTGTRTFPLDLSHYQNFYQRGGCLLLVIEILSPTNTKIFYKQLLPAELKQIIDTWQHQKTFSIGLRPLEETTLYIVCRKFIDQMKKQPQVLIENNQYKEEDYEKILFTSLTFNPDTEPIQDIVNHDFILYGLKDNIQYPIRNMRPEAIAVEDYEEIDIGGKKFQVRVESRYMKPKMIKIIEGCLEFIIHEGEKNFKFNIRGVYSLSTQLKILPLIIKFLKVGKIEFSDFYWEISNENNIKEYVQRLENSYSLFLELKVLFFELDVNQDVQFGNKDNIILEIKKIINVMINKDYSGFKIERPESPSFFKYMIGDVYLLLFYNPHSDNKLINPFSQELLEMPIRVFSDEDGQSARVSPYLMLEEESLINADNLNIDYIIKSFEYIEFDKYELTFSPLNKFSLACLNAYDVTRNKEFLRIPLYLYKQLKEVIPDSPESGIITVNLLQTVFREQYGLKSEDYNELMKLKKENTPLEDSEELIFCINVLLESKKEAAILYEEFDEDKKEFYKTLPIYTLYKNLFSQSSKRL
ncbi:hypothetical protein [Lentibacillus salicampi]|uniref:DUF4365 domain-containing protein n=1 Tax=Lentibacillus salicampi TaxID=175306 RepID=A0A4Y9AAZ7_9BACI|nr:hypothetical protein [Lentibacillus salicampi]TFJ91521.1 hypothetical protein E4U82_17195 [Lentibacillus salicampi]